MGFKYRAGPNLKVIGVTMQRKLGETRGYGVANGLLVG